MTFLLKMMLAKLKVCEMVKVLDSTDAFRNSLCWLMIIIHYRRQVVWCVVVTESLGFVREECEASSPMFVVDCHAASTDIAVDGDIIGVTAVLQPKIGNVLRTCAGIKLVHYGPVPVMTVIKCVSLLIVI